MAKIDWHGIVAIILAVGASTTLVILAIQELFHTGHVTGEEATLLSTALGAVVGAVATYLGIKSTSNGGPDDRPKDV